MYHYLLTKRDEGNKMSKLEEKAAKVRELFEVLKEYEYVEIFTTDNNSKYIEIDGVTFCFGEDGKLIEAET